MSAIPLYDEDFYCDEFIADPWPHYANMRALGPVVWLPRHQNFALTRHAAVAAAVRNHETSGKGVAADSVANEMTKGNSAASDGARHAAIRGATSVPLLPGVLEAVRGRIESSAEALIESLLAKESFDAVADFARHLRRRKSFFREHAPAARSALRIAPAPKSTRDRTGPAATGPAARQERRKCVGEPLNSGGTGQI